MTQPLDIKGALHHLETALEASCAALVALETLRARMADVAPDICGAQSQIRQTVAALREAIGELRCGRDEYASAAAFGFVLGADSERSRRTHVRPRRTA